MLSRAPSGGSHVISGPTGLHDRTAGHLSRCDVLPDCDGAMRGYMRLGASRQRQKIVADVLMVAAGRSTGGFAQGRANRANIGQASSGRTRTVRHALVPQRSTVPAESLCPTLRRRGRNRRRPQSAQARTRLCPGCAACQRQSPLEIPRANSAR
jgi:hypothetical protein